MKPLMPENDREYQTALRRARLLMHAAPDSPEGRELAAWTVLLEKYEAREFPLDDPDPVDAIVFYMEQRGLKQRDLVAYFGSRARVSEVLSRKRSLTLPMIRNLHRGLGIPADLLIAPSRPARASRPSPSTGAARRSPKTPASGRRTTPRLRKTAKSLS